MTYNEWRDELKSNLLCVSESERRRVLDYYAEAYADRREAGFSEKEIIDDFGAPYDAAQRILADNRGDEYFEKSAPQRPQEKRRENTPPPPPPPAPAQPVGQPADNTWVFILLCVIFCVPLFGLIMTMVGVTIGFCAAPIIVIGAGAAAIGGGIGAMVTGDFFYGLGSAGAGLVALGIGIILCPVFFKLVKLMWTLFKKVFGWLKSLFSGRKEFA